LKLSPAIQKAPPGIEITAISWRFSKINGQPDHWSSAMIRTMFGRSLDSALSRVVEMSCGMIANETEKAKVAILCRK
jgi:hypothetical protein